MRHLLKGENWDRHLTQLYKGQYSSFTQALYYTELSFIKTELTHWTALAQLQPEMGEINI